MNVNAGSPRHHIDVVVFASPLVRVGRWRCPADHPQFRDSGPSSEALFAFPREGVWIEHDGRAPFVADPNTVTYYNRGQSYRRRRLSARGDQCEWFAVAEEVIAETLAAHEPAAIGRELPADHLQCCDWRRHGKLGRPGHQDRSPGTSIDVKRCRFQWRKRFIALIKIF